MPLVHNGLAKLAEECGELTQVAAKKIAYPNTDAHPDGSLLTLRLQDEIADVLAAIEVVRENFKLDASEIEFRVARKLALFRRWRNEP